MTLPTVKNDYTNGQKRPYQRGCQRGSNGLNHPFQRGSNGGANCPYYYVVERCAAWRACALEEKGTDAMTTRRRNWPPRMSYFASLHVDPPPLGATNLLYVSGKWRVCHLTHIDRDKDTLEWAESQTPRQSLSQFVSGIVRDDDGFIDAMIVPLADRSRLERRMRHAEHRARNAAARRAARTAALIG